MAVDLTRPVQDVPESAFTSPAIDVEGVRRDFGSVAALDGVSLAVDPGEIHALLGPNGAGKTTLVRVLAGLVQPSAGSAYLLDRPVGRSAALRSAVGHVHSGDRSFYLRISGLENLVFFARLHGMRRREARARAREVLAAVELGEVAKRPVNTYSHGMQKRLSFARALLTRPRVLLVDEATHDLDPVAARRVRDLTRDLAAAGAAVLWTTQRVEELTGFAGRVTVLARGRVRFSGSLAALIAHAPGARHELRLEPGWDAGRPEVDAALRGIAVLERVDDDGRHAVIRVEAGATLGDAIVALARAGAVVENCRESDPPIERAFLALTTEQRA